MIEGTCATTAKEKSPIQGQQENEVQPISANQSVKSQESKFCQPTIVVPDTATTITTSITDNDDNNNKKDAYCTNNERSNKKGDIQHNDDVECKIVNLDNVSATTELENTLLKSSDHNKNTNTNTANICRRENGDVSEQTTMKADDNAGNVSNDVQKNDEMSSKSYTNQVSSTTSTQSRSLDGTNGDATKLPPKE